MPVIIKWLGGVG